MPSSSALSFPVYFVCRRPAKWADILGGADGASPHPDEIFARIVDNEDCWTIQTYLMLKHRGLDVRLVTDFVPESVCVVNGLDLGIRNQSWNSFVIACRSDGFDPVLADVVVVQNQRQARHPREVHIPHWPQPGLVPRATERSSRIENVVFKGDVKNLHPPFRSPEFHRALQDMGLRLLIDGKDSMTDASWQDYSRADVVLAVRDLGTEEALAKPASKLVNAWLAGTPAILGPEPAFRDLRRSNLDYVEATRPDQALDALRRLIERPDLYLSMVTNGRGRSTEFTPEALTDRWHAMLTGRVAESFAEWSRRSRASRAMRFGMRAATHHRSMAQVQRAQAGRDRILQ